MKKLILFVCTGLLWLTLISGAMDNRNGTASCEPVNSWTPRGQALSCETNQPLNEHNHEASGENETFGPSIRQDQYANEKENSAGKQKPEMVAETEHSTVQLKNRPEVASVHSVVQSKKMSAVVSGHSTMQYKKRPAVASGNSEVQPMDTISADTGERNEKTKTGWTFGAVPAIAYDTDRGFKYGGLVNFYHFGDGKIYPKYRHSIYLEWSRTTRGSGINQFRYDSEYLIPNVRVTAEASYLTEKALDFYGFNGREALYNPDFEDQDQKAEYISRMYYRHERDLLRLKADFQGSIIGRRLRWLAGFVHYGINTGEVDIDNLNKGKDEADMLPDTAGIYQKYADWNIISGKEKDGGNTNFLKLGLVYDTRDNEPNPNSGIWTELLFNMAPGFLGNKDYSFTKLALTHRQYFTLFPGQLTLAYRLSYQPKISGDMPFYMLPFIYNSRLTVDGVGGKKTIRGILLNRLAGEGYAFGNIEFRWKFIKTVLFNQNIYVALSTFLDGGMVTDYYDIQDESINNLKSDNPAAYRNHFTGEDESLHLSYGTGLHFALNENFIVAVDYGRALDAPDDGISGFYIGMDFLY